MFYILYIIKDWAPIYSIDSSFKIRKEYSIERWGVWAWSHQRDSDRGGCPAQGSLLSLINFMTLEIILHESFSNSEQIYVRVGMMSDSYNFVLRLSSDLFYD